MQSTDAHLPAVVRLSDSQLAAAEAVAAAPLPDLPQADAHFFGQCMKMLDTLPRRKDDDVSGELRFRAYEIAIGSRPKDAIQFLVTEALRNCKFFPSTSECVEILSRWERADDAVRMRRECTAAARRERNARFDELMARLSAGSVEQDEIDGLSVVVKRIAETRGYLRLNADGTWTARHSGRVE